jgi:LuxR family maltose regulon positive regulatory protein
LTGPASLNRFSTGRQFVIEYLVEEVLRRLPETIRTFLLQTSILDRLNGPLCDALTSRQDSQEFLEELVKANLFLLPLDAGLDREGEWYRYHRLFSAALSSELKPQEKARLHHIALNWLERSGISSASGTPWQPRLF